MVTLTQIEAAIQKAKNDISTTQSGITSALSKRMSADNQSNAAYTAMLAATDPAEKARQRAIQKTKDALSASLTTDIANLRSNLGQSQGRLSDNQRQLTALNQAHATTKDPAKIPATAATNYSKSTTQASAAATGAALQTAKMVKTGTASAADLLKNKSAAIRLEGVKTNAAAAATQATQDAAKAVRSRTNVVVEGRAGTEIVFEDGTTEFQDGEDIVVSGGTNAAVPNPPSDRRLRINTLAPLSSLMDDGLDPSENLLAPLLETGGVLFPYTPTINFTHSVNYTNLQPTHANTDYMLYQNTPSVKFNIDGQFSAQTEEEALYLLSAMHFFRTVSKMRFGAKDPKRGLAPPVCRLNGYGSYMFNDLPVVITEFSMDMPPNVQHVTVEFNGEKNWVPSLTTFHIQCVVQQTPRAHREEFSWSDFASGKLIDDGGWV